MNTMLPADRIRPLGKFQDPDVTAKGEQRAEVALTKPETIWFNTGTLCNIECINCYIESSPTNDRLVYITADEVSTYLSEIAELGWPVQEIAFTGGEPFMNPEMIEITERSLAAGFEVLILTNAMRPMMRKRVLAGLERLHAAYPGKLTLRISLDHFKPAHHDEERGTGAYDKTLEGMRWLRDAGLKMAVAGRTMWGDSDAESRAGYAALFDREGFAIDAMNPGETVLFPEMDEKVDVPEITTACWGILDKSPTEVMCSSSRMVVKRKGAERPTVNACTNQPNAPEFELGATHEEAAR
ncbi:MAG: radical SAM protein, partial [Pseudomonadota bacterium]